MNPRTLVFLPLCLLAAGAARAQTITPANWFNNRAGVISLTFDDSLSGHWSHADPIMTAAGVRGTFFVITNTVDWNGARSAALNGHEIGSHSTDGATFQNVPLATVLAKMQQSHDAIETQIGAVIPGYRCDTIGWPFGFRREDAINDPAGHPLYLGARLAGKALLAANSYNIPNVALWWKYNTGAFFDMHYFVRDDALMTTATTLTTFNSQLDLVEAQSAWTVFTYHGIETGGYENISAANFTAQVAAVAARKDSTLWVAPFGEVIRYVRQRMAVAAAVTGTSGSTLTVSVTDSLDNGVYNLPLTLMFDAPAGWTGVSAAQAGAPVPAWMAAGKVLFNAVPDAGEVVIQGTAPPAPEPPVVTLDRTASGLSLAFDSADGATYTLESAPAPAGPWDAAAGIDPVIGDGGPQAITLEPMPVLPAFYRLRVE